MIFIVIAEKKFGIRNDASLEVDGKRRKDEND